MNQSSKLNLMTEAKSRCSSRQRLNELCTAIATAPTALVGRVPLGRQLGHTGVGAASLHSFEGRSPLALNGDRTM